jgi:hypothetical protein
MTDTQRCFIVGDIHGCLDMLKELMAKIDWRPNRDRLIFLGDYIDRGEDSKGVIDFLIDLMNMSPHVEGLMGNHESLFLNYLEGDKEDEELFLINGGATTLNSYRMNRRIIFGHTPFPFPLIMDNKIGLDTGAVFGNSLTCMEIPGMKFHSVEA